MQPTKQYFLLKLTNGYYKSQRLTGVFQTPYLKIVETTYQNNPTIVQTVHIIDNGSIRGLQNKGNIVRVRVEHDTVVDFDGMLSEKDLIVQAQAIRDHKETPQIIVPEETDEEVISRIRERFKAMDTLVEYIASGAIKSLIIAGAPGVGKSFGIQRALEAKHKLQGFKYEFVKGTMSTACLFEKLYEFREHKSILVFDDCDSVLNDSESLNLFKAALDSSDTRTVTYGKQNKDFERRDIPRSFDFQGSVIFISNKDFDKEKKSADLTEHLRAFQDRSHFLDLTVSSLREKCLRIKQVVLDTPILKARGFSEEQVNDILNFLESTLEDFREVNLRLVSKISDLVVCDPEGWKEIAKVTLTRTKKY